jgi:hypothetical protein
MHDPDSRREGWRGERTPIDVEGCAVTQHDVSRTRLHGAAVWEAPGRLASVPPDRVSAAGVIVVRPDEELKALPPELETGAEVIHRPVTHLRITQLCRVKDQLHDNRPTLEPCPMKGLQGANRVGEGFVIYDEPGALLPGLRWGHSGEHDDTTAQHGRPWRCHWATVPEGCSPDCGSS